MKTKMLHVKDDVKRGWGTPKPIFFFFIEYRFGANTKDGHKNLDKNVNQSSNPTYRNLPGHKIYLSPMK